ncbi:MULTISPECIES: hypothetical protein [Natrinema]|uniref:Uncharacterized protein n=2 Tax=Natrinema TaxID=88723 RepID=M0C2F7_9EURY|nr:MULTISPECIES: hypothetical protein [Natrinema]ELZ17471.1 hypothetical protein C476_16015 [Natrinema limicola JCM 13563]RZV06254.1 hypothetical protein BDK88_3799 [Natrinema hispanicum]
MATVETVLSSIFSTIPELHSGQLGLLAGLLVGVLYWHEYHRSSLGLLTGCYLLALGVVPASTKGLAVVQSKPWYFCSFLILTALGAIGGRTAWRLVSRSIRARSPTIRHRAADRETRGSSNQNRT